MRWQSNKFGVVSPDIFIPLIEQSGEFISIEDMVKDKPWETAVSWPEKISISINYSALEMCDPGMSKRIKSNCAFSGLALHRFDLEITETAKIQNSKIALRNIVELKDQGVRITLDDFGTGHANLDCLLKYPFDTVKIDKMFLIENTSCCKAEKILEGIITLAHSLDIIVLAEGVENHEQINQLKELGCDKVQGFFISPPVLPQDITHLLKSYEYI